MEKIVKFLSSGQANKLILSWSSEKKFANNKTMMMMIKNTIPTDRTKAPPENGPSLSQF